MTVGDSELQGYDEAQKEMMSENCIIVDEDDNITGQDSKINCHLGDGKLHRAFSVLIFNSNDKLLIQQRADEKITFPSIWANSCCSHPLYQDREEEGIEGAKKAATQATLPPPTKSKRLIPAASGRMSSPALNMRVK